MKGVLHWLPEIVERQVRCCSTGFDALGRWSGRGTPSPVEAPLATVELLFDLMSHGAVVAIISRRSIDD